MKEAFAVACMRDLMLGLAGGIFVYFIVLFCECGERQAVATVRLAAFPQA